MCDRRNMASISGMSLVYLQVGFEVAADNGLREGADSYARSIRVAGRAEKVLEPVGGTRKVHTKYETIVR